MRQPSRKMPFFDWRTKIFFPAAEYARDEVGEVIFLAQGDRGVRLLVPSKKHLVSGRIIDGQVSFRTVEDVTDAVVPTFDGTETSFRFLSQLSCGPTRAEIDLRVRDPMAYFEFEH